MNLKLLVIYFALASIALSIESFSLDKTGQYINPTGSYSLVSKTKIRGGEIFGVTGDIQVKALSKSKVAIVLGVNMGAPAYNSGALIDTLMFKNNMCVYKGDNYDPSCKIVFIFTKYGIRVTQKQADINNGCGFGHGVFADGFYRKRSYKIPTLKDPQTGELIK